MNRRILLAALLLLLGACASSPTGEQFCYPPDTTHSSGLGGSTQLCLGYP